MGYRKVRGHEGRRMTRKRRGDETCCLCVYSRKVVSSKSGIHCYVSHALMLETIYVILCYTIYRYIVSVTFQIGHAPSNSATHVLSTNSEFPTCKFSSVIHVLGTHNLKYFQLHLEGTK